MACGKLNQVCMRSVKSRLNPSFSGIWPVAISLILFLDMNQLLVLILLLVEYGLWLLTKETINNGLRGLNPSFSGIWPVAFLSLCSNTVICVLILLLVEYGLWPFRLPTWWTTK